MAGRKGKGRGRGNNNNNSSQQQTSRRVTLRSQSTDSDMLLGGGSQLLSNYGCDVDNLQHTILTRVNQTLSSQQPSAEGASNNPSTDAMKAFINQALPAIVTSVALAVGEVLEKVLQKHTTPAQEINTNLHDLQRSVLLLKYENDKLEQYTRRETVRIVGLKEEQDENIEKKVIDLFKTIDVEVTAADLSVVHRTGRRRESGGARHVLARFVSRKKKIEVMTNRKHLKGREGYTKVFINEDLTVLRSKLLAFVKGSDRFGRVWTVDGKIYVGKKQPLGAPRDEKERPIIIENADDLFKLGFNADTVDPEKLGLQDWWLDEEPDVNSR